MDGQIPAGDESWQLSEDAFDDPEEERVLFAALDSFAQYAKLAHYNTTHLRRQALYALPQAEWQMLAAPPFSYLQTLDKVDEAIDKHGELARTIVKYGLLSMGLADVSNAGEPMIPEKWQGRAIPSDLDKARSTIRQFYRDWSEGGKKEREASYHPIKKAVADECKHQGRSRLKVLVPGAGLGRLVFDLCHAGHEVEGNEISYHQLLASSYILNHVPEKDAHTIYPWIHSFSNHKTRADHLRGYKVPDAHPATDLMALGEAQGTMSMTAADFLLLYSDDDHKDIFDAVACVFFLDTAPNLIRYLETIRHCLKPGGILINLGPLLWHFENNAPGKSGDSSMKSAGNGSTGIADPGSFELAEDEVIALLEKMSFSIEIREDNIDAAYIQDPDSMLQTIYKGSFWVARNKPT